MEPKSKFWYYVLSFLKWIGTAIEDQAGSVSWKRISAGILLWKLITMVGVPGITLQEYMVIAGSFLLCMGYTIPEWFSQVSTMKKGEAGMLPKPPEQPKQ